MLGLVQGLVQGRVVAGRFWCSYACVSLTQTARARPRAPVFCTRVRARGVEGACARVRASSRRCAAVWCCWVYAVVWCAVVLRWALGVLW